MYEYIKGILTQVDPTQAVVEAGGVGYSLLISLQTYSQIHTQQQVTLWVHHIVREDAQLLYGFAGRDEREIFRHLISVAGVGPNSARMILSALSGVEVRNALIAGDVLKLKSIKGIGTKTAERMVVELKDKMVKVGLENTGGAGTPGSEGVAGGSVGAEASSALQLLGFAKAPVEKVLTKIILENPAISLEDLIKHALKAL